MATTATRTLKETRIKSALIPVFDRLRRVVRSLLKSRPVDMLWAFAVLRLLKA